MTIWMRADKRVIGALAFIISLAMVLTACTAPVEDTGAANVEGPTMAAEVAPTEEPEEDLGETDVDTDAESPAPVDSDADADSEEPMEAETESASIPSADAYTVEEYALPAGSHPHDVAPAPDGTVWYTAQHAEALGNLDPTTGETRHIHLGSGSRPHGVIVGPDGAPWITDGGLNAIVRVDPETEAVEVFPLPDSAPNANLNTATFDNNGVLWFTGQNGVYGRLDPAEGVVEAFEAPRGRGPYGITTTPSGEVYYASLAGSHIARIDTSTGEAEVLEPPTPGQGARRVWSDSQGVIWISEWNAGQVGRYDPSDGSWQEWPLPGSMPRAYSVYVDEFDLVWLSDFGSQTIVRFDPVSETFASYSMESATPNVRQMLGRPGEVWGAESGADKLVVLRY